MFFKNNVGIAIFIVLALHLMHSVAFAGGKLVDSGCSSVKIFRVYCYQCGDTKAYLGKLSLPGDSEYADDSLCCLSPSIATKRCAEKFQVSSDSIGYYTTFNMKNVSREETYNKSCIAAVGKQ